MGRLHQARGFTLIEMSIVLVIIGLIVGGVLVGQSVINAAAIRAQVTQFEQFNHAVNTFRDKYYCMPGDCENATTLFPTLSSYYCTAYACSNGNGNGVIDEWTPGGCCNTTGFPFEVQGEVNSFWLELQLAGLTDSVSFSHTSTSLMIGQQFPQDRVNGYGISVGVMQGRNGYFWGINTNQPTATSTYQEYTNLSPGSTWSAVVTPAQAQAFDTKIDDGYPTTGNVYAAVLDGGDNFVHPSWVHGGNNCFTVTTAYNTGYSSIACGLWINMQAGD
jgi:prepilin-type N-terminal cleavage/methylation domain-containing protein